MKQGDVTAETVARAIARIQQAAQSSASDTFRACLQELTGMQESIARGESPDPDKYPEGVAALRFVDQLDRSSLGTHAAQGLRARTGPEAMRRIAGCQQELNAGETEAGPEDEQVSGAEPHTSQRFCSRVRVYGAKRLKQRETPAEGSRSQPFSKWSVRTDTRSDLPGVICKVRVRLVVSDVSSILLPAEFRYRPTDPYAIKATFHTGSDESVSWVFARETAAAGLRTHAGAGDVKIWPRHGSESEVICISLGATEGTALLEVPRAALQTFLRKSNDLVAPGTEGQHLDIDKSFDLITYQARGGSAADKN
ncbi:SsgA family sporulation/cell division regulator [Streptomyces sp. NPDC048211]|uniref:SsgA family sporulation/cell division regulator n=1 Tax=Streptomyces sp. NPDC048211 TaxID=3365516 RepID=UPI003713F082